MFGKTLKIIGWSAGSALALTAVFYPGAGLIEGGPAAAATVGLLGAGMCLHARRQLACAKAD